MLRFHVAMRCCSCTLRPHTHMPLMLPQVVTSLALTSLVTTKPAMTGQVLITAASIRKVRAGLPSTSQTLTRLARRSSAPQMHHLQLR
jgi:hypothetical protein